MELGAVLLTEIYPQHKEEALALLQQLADEANWECANGRARRPESFSIGTSTSCIGRYDSGPQTPRQTCAVPLLSPFAARPTAAILSDASRYSSLSSRST